MVTSFTNAALCDNFMKR